MTSFLSVEAPEGAAVAELTSRPARYNIGHVRAQEITQLLRASRDGGTDAMSVLLPFIYSELRRIASGHLRRYDNNHSLQPTEVIHEAWLRIAQSEQPQWQDRVHFFAFAASVIRNILVDYARSKTAQKRGGDAVKVQLDEALAYAPERPHEIVALDDALKKLAGIDPRKAQILELRFFAGFDVEETAEALGISVATVGRETRFAQAWLRKELREDPDSGGVDKAPR